jgi:hypothetical protein
MLRMILDPLDEAAFLDLWARHGAVGNCAVTRWDTETDTVARPPRLRLTLANRADHLTAEHRTA